MPENPTKVVLLAIALIISAFPLSAEPILDLRFNDPERILSSQPEGLVDLTPAQLKTGVSSGLGGVATPNFVAKTGSNYAGGETAARFQILADPPFPGVPSFFRANYGIGSQFKMIGLRITHDSLDNSLSALAKPEGGHLHLNGGFDFFFRLGSDASDYTGKMNLWAKLDRLTFTISSEAEGGKGMRMALSAQEPIFALNGGTTPSAKGAQSRFATELPLTAGEILHAAVRFTTTPDGLITIELYLQEGVGEIVPGGGSLNSVIEGVRIFPEEGGSSELDRIVLNLVDQNLAQSLDVAAFRIFKPAPDAFPGL